MPDCSWSPPPPPPPPSPPLPTTTAPPGVTRFSHEDVRRLTQPHSTPHPPTDCERSQCGPGLAVNRVTGSCEWPDTLIAAGCNPELLTGFGPCPQNQSDPHLNPTQRVSWPYPM